MSISFSWVSSRWVSTSCFGLGCPARLAGSAPHERPKQHRQRAIQSVDLDFAVRPVVQRPPRADVPVFHLVKDLLDHKLAPIGPDDLGIAPFLVTGDEQRFARSAE